MHVVKFTCGHFPQQGHIRSAFKVTYISTAASFTLMFLAAPMKARYFLKSKIMKYTAVQILQRPLKRSIINPAKVSSKLTSFENFRYNTSLW